MDQNTSPTSPSIQEEEGGVRKSRSDRDDLHKRKNIKMSSGVCDNRLLRAIKNEDRRKSSRRDMLDMRRQIIEEEDTETEEALFFAFSDYMDPEKHQENKENTCYGEETVGDTEGCETNEEDENIFCKGNLPQKQPVAANPVDEAPDTESKVIETVTKNDHADISANDPKLKESKVTSENKFPESLDCKDEATTQTLNNTETSINDEVPNNETNNVNLKAHDLKPLKKAPTNDLMKAHTNDMKNASTNDMKKAPTNDLKKAPTNDRREKLQQYLAEKKKLAQVKRRNEKPAFRATGKIQHDLGPVGAHKPNMYSIGGTRKENSSDRTKNGSFVSRKGACVSRTGSALPRNGSNFTRTGSNLSRTGSNMPGHVLRPGSNLLKNGSTSSKNGSTLSKNGSSLSRSHSTLSRKTLTMIR